MLHGYMARYCLAVPRDCVAGKVLGELPYAVDTMMCRLYLWFRLT